MAKDDLTLEQSIQELMSAAPPPVQTLIKRGKLGDVAQSLMERYALHIDHGAILEHQLMLVLLGVEGPEEFAEALYDKLPVSQQTVSDIISDLNKDVFTPLREELKKGKSADASRPGMQTSPIPANPAMPGAMTIQPAGRPSTPPPVRITPPSVPPAAPSTSSGQAPKADVAPLPPKVIMPSPSVASRVGGPTARPVIPAPPDHMLPIGEKTGSTMPPAQTLPGTNIPVPGQTLAPAPSQPPAQPAASAPKIPTPPAPKQYNVDPYREPIDDGK